VSSGLLVADSPAPQKWGPQFTRRVVRSAAVGGVSEGPGSPTRSAATARIAKGTFANNPEHSRTIPNNPEHPEHSRTIPNNPEHSRTLPNTPEPSRTLPNNPEHSRTFQNGAAPPAVTRTCRALVVQATPKGGEDATESCRLSRLRSVSARYPTSLHLASASARPSRSCSHGWLTACSTLPKNTSSHAACSIDQSIDRS
jgi:hypothetical protein